ncbi:hypothetical protein [Mesobacillus sp. S13]|uniref:hypothetical protein n=1 Tax=Mesobacillus sp. S13 TaxID=2880221 RepID=UPI001CF4381F|nr:hypothetical protein [Mesobacillus sp. S13]
MRLTKTLYVINKTESDEPSSIDEFGRGKYDLIETKTPLLGEVEPFSNRLAETRYGVFVDVTNRAFCMPNDLIKINGEIEYDNQNFIVTECMKYDRHYEVLLKKVF